ncbi:MAG: TIGR03067 domain-containing protein [Pirellulales bacterium]
MKLGIATALAFGLVWGAAAVQAEETLDGTWTLSAGEVDGKALTEEQLQDAKLVINGDHYTVTLEGMGTVTGMQILDPTQNPKTINITDADGPRKGQTYLGIYDLVGDEYRVAFAMPGNARPADFSLTTDGGNWIHVWKRATE